MNSKDPEFPDPDPWHWAEEGLFSYGTKTVPTDITIHG